MASDIKSTFVVPPTKKSSDFYFTSYCKSSHIASRKKKNANSAIHKTEHWGYHASRWPWYYNNM